MKALPISVALLSLALLPVLPAPTAACDDNGFCARSVRWAQHHDPAAARLAITTEDRKVTLLLTDRVVAVQLSERTLHKLDRELHDAEAQDNWFGAVIASAVVGTVREVLDKSFECRIRDLRDVSYEDGRLRFIRRDGRTVFHHVQIDDTDFAAAFSESDARRFVEEFRRAKAENL